MAVRTPLVVLFAALLAIAYARLSVPVVAYAGEEMEEASALPAPETKSDYTVLAGKYDDLAKDARAEAERHRKMAESYKGGMKSAYRERMMKHCDEIVKLQEKLSDQYGAIAEDYRAEAAAME